MKGRNQDIFGLGVTFYTRNKCILGILAPTLESRNMYLCVGLSDLSVYYTYNRNDIHKGTYTKITESDCILDYYSKKVDISVPLREIVYGR